MKNRLAFLLIAFWGALLGAFSQEVYFEKPDGLSVQRGGQVTLSICMTNSIDIYGWDMKIALPDGFSLVNGTSGSKYEMPRNDDSDQNVLTVQKLSSGNSFLFTHYTGLENHYLGNSGEMIKIPLSIR